MSTLVHPPKGEPLITDRVRSTNVMLGIGLKVASVCVFVCMSSLLKASDGIPAGQLVFFRSFFAIFPVIAFIAWQGQLGVAFKTNEPFSHFWRGLVGVSAMSLSFYGLTKLPLPESIAISYATPLLTVVCSAIFLRETVRLYRWSAVCVGLIGVVIILWPRMSFFTGETEFGADQAVGALATLGGAGLAAIAMLLVRKLVQTERTPTIVVYFSIASSIIALVSLPFGWVWPTTFQAVCLILAGIAGGVAQILLTESYRHADMSAIAPFEYTSMLLGLALGYLLFGDIPTAEMVTGAAIVISAGIFIIYREHRLGLARARARKVSTPQG
ncbi:drug/metabolite transporter (DMT)-like permease [Phyllobacterium endophyticum]|uniref:EamA family transporter n=2 Tax=Phyllobacterium endophyticum TaxID=1149773 RepID=A0A2P7B284_9HYPH|nr:drug/metabolite transporter (DMT)-like permease [Phyllobacterium endophyticum]PSH60558.1 EamA family transporter [Phyllobacterium endophyticum]TYR42733.1 DMT family transporter [Phyllobacterium endophyticum]